jgi:AAHS family 4-hydroxybenzoate transporter-like MFS transporter
MLGIFSLLTVGAHTLPELGMLRFLTGLGLGGLPANTIAIMAEYAPRRSRALMIALMFMGITFGGMVPAIVTSVAPDAGWQALFIVGSVMPMVAALLNFIYMPESLKFLALREHFSARLVAIARRMRPEMAVPENARFEFVHHSIKKFVVRMLFVDKLRTMTPLIWVMFITNLMANFFLNSWMPTLFSAAGLSATQAALTTSMYYVGAVLGNQLGLNSVLGLVYPTAIRANGSGWALGIGRLGAIVGPLIGGVLIAQHLPLQFLYMVPMVPLLIGAGAAYLLKRQTGRNLSSNEDEIMAKLEAV